MFNLVKEAKNQNEREIECSNFRIIFKRKIIFVDQYQKEKKSKDLKTAQGFV